MTGRILGFISNRPELGAQLLRANSEHLDVKVSADEPVGWGVGFYQMGELLLRRRPIDDRSVIAIATLAEKVDTDVLIGFVGRPNTGELRTENTQPFRYRQWLFAQAGAIEGYAQLRATLLEEEPEFLLRNRRGDADSELLFYAILSVLNDSEQLHAPLVSSAPLNAGLCKAIRRLDELAARAGTAPSKLDVLLTNGEVLGVIHRSGTLASRKVSGRQQVEEVLGDDLGSIARSQSSEKARCTLVAGSLDELPAMWERLPHPAVITIGRTEDPLIEML